MSYQEEADALKKVNAVFEKYQDEFLKFQRIVNKRSQRADLHAFLLLDELSPNHTGADIVGGAEHDIIYLNVDIMKVAAATEEQLLELRRCGVIVDSESESLAMHA